MLLANSLPFTDTVLRPSATGLTSVLSLRSPSAPSALSWQVALAPGQQLAALPSGAVAVIEPAEAGTVAPTFPDPLAPEPSQAEREQALSNTDAQMTQASDDLERAQNGTADRIVAVIPAPWAKDAGGQPIPAALAAAGSTVTLQIPRATGTSYPVSAGYSYVSRDAVDEYESRKTVDSIPADAFDTTSEVSPEPTDPEPPPPAAAAAEADTESMDGISSQEDAGPTVTDSGAPARAESSRALTQGVLDGLTLGITAGDPATITNPNYGVLNPEAVRPFAPWKTLAMSASNPEAKQWRDWNAAAKARGIRVDVTLTRDALRGAGGTANATYRNYETQIKKFVKVYGGSDGTIKNLMAYNEPNYAGTGEPVAGGTDKGDPLKSYPELAAKLYYAAVRACFPASGKAYCVRQGADGKWRRGRVIAGEFTEADRLVRKRRYTTRYYNEIANKPRSGWPRVWSFHDCGDFRTYELRRGRAQKAATRLNYYANLFNQDKYRYQDGSATRRPDTWLTEGGASYTFPCERIKDPSPCPASPRQVVLFGMRKQNAALAFMVRTMVTKYTNVKRLYYFNLRSGYRKCNSNLKLGLFRCKLDERGLIGTEDDPIYQQRAAASPPTPVVPVGAGANDYSAAGDRRLAFCLLRDRRASQVRAPWRVTRTSCPAR